MNLSKDDGVSKDAPEERWTAGDFVVAGSLALTFATALGAGIYLVAESNAIQEKWCAKTEAARSLKQASDAEQFKSVSGNLAWVVCKDEATGKKYAAFPESVEQLSAKKAEGCVLKPR